MYQCTECQFIFEYPKVVVVQGVYPRAFQKECPKCSAEHIITLQED